LLVLSSGGLLLHLHTAGLNARLGLVEEELRLLRHFVHGPQAVETNEERNRRHAAEAPGRGSFDGYSEDGVPVRNKKYQHYKRDRQGFRVYNAWSQHRRENQIRNDPRVVLRHPTDAPIRAHHRKSAAWVNAVDDDDFLDFGDSMYNDPAPKRITILRGNSAFNSINHGGNRAKVTNMDEYEKNEQQKEKPRSTTTSSSTSSPTTEVAELKELNEHMRNSLSSNRTVASGEAASERRLMDRRQETMERGRWRSSVRAGARNRAGLRSGRHRLKSRIGLGERQAPRMAIHMEASVADPEGANYSGAGRLRVADSIFRDWTPARWARRLKMDKKFSLKDGRLTVSSAGIYYIYAQINYLDEHDVNAFQIYVNDSPFLLCTTMTHTPTPTTKANSCYTGGVSFLEKGDKVLIKNLEENRFSVMLSSHSFFGLVQVADLGI